MTVKVGQVYKHPRYAEDIQIVTVGSASCMFRFISGPVKIEMFAHIANMEHWPLIRDICDHCGKSFRAIETYTAPDPDDGRRALTICGDCHHSRAYLDRAGDEAEVRY